MVLIVKTTRFRGPRPQSVIALSGRVLIIHCSPVLTRTVTKEDWYIDYTVFITKEVFCIKNKKDINKRWMIVLIIFLFVIIMHHIYNNSYSFYEIKYPKENISKVLEKDSFSEDDYMVIFNQTGVSPGSAKKLIDNGEYMLLEAVQKLYFKKPKIKKSYIAFPVTVSEKNTSYRVPFVDIKKGDILVTFNTHTLDWRHGHCAIVIDEKEGHLIEHMSIGNPSCTTNIREWRKYPSFVVLRYHDEDIASKAAEYAENHLVGIDYNVFAGVLKKDKSQVENLSSQCAHIVWQAYKAVGVDIDSSKDVFVVPKDIAMSDGLNVVQIYGINPSDYKSRVLTVTID